MVSSLPVGQPIPVLIHRREGNFYVVLSLPR
jgi:serine protease Do